MNIIYSFFLFLFIYFCTKKLERKIILLFNYSLSILWFYVKSNSIPNIDPKVEGNRHASKGPLDVKQIEELIEL